MESSLIYLNCTIDHMHMTSQKGAQLRWGSNETLPRASSPSMQPGGANPASHTAGLARPGPRTERLSANAHCQHNTCALRDTRLASLLWRCDPLLRQCIRSIVDEGNILSSEAQALYRSIQSLNFTSKCL